MAWPHAKNGKTVWILNLAVKVNATISFRLVRPRRATKRCGSDDRNVTGSTTIDCKFLRPCAAFFQ